MDPREQIGSLTDTVGGIHTDATVAEFREGCYGGPHQIDVAGSTGINEGEDVDGRG